MRVNIGLLLHDQVENGIRGGLNKCFKRDLLHDDHEEAAVQEIHTYVMNAIAEYFSFDDEYEGTDPRAWPQDDSV